MESESTRPRVPIRVANKPELRKYELSSEGVTCAMMEVVTPVVVAKENKMEFYRLETISRINSQSLGVSHLLER